MQATIPTKTLKATLTAACRVIGRAANAKALCYDAVALDVADGRLRIRATDLDRMLETSIGTAHYPDACFYYVPAKALLDAVTAMPGDTVDLEARDGEIGLSVRSGAASRTIPWMTNASLPEMPSVPVDAPRVTLPASVLADMFARADVTRAGEDKAVISGVLVESDGAVLNIVSTDGYRLSTSRAVLSGDARPMGGVLPGAFVAEAVKILKGYKRADISLVMVDRGAWLVMPGAVLAAKLIDMQYPAYQQIIPHTFKGDVTFNRAAMMAAVKACAIPGEKAKRADCMVVRISVGDFGKAVVSSEQNTGSASVPVEIRGEDLTTSFNADFLVEALEHFATDEVNIAFNGRLSPVIVTAAGSQDRALVMPVNRA